MKITVLIPTKDRSLYLKHTLMTCITQDYANAEFIVLDDASSDDTAIVVTQIIKLDKRVRLVRNEINLGMRANFENGLNLVNEGYVLFLGGDDGLMPNALRVISELIRSTGTPLLTWPTHSYFYRGARSGSGQLIYRRGTKRSELNHIWLDSKEFLSRQSKELFYVSDIKCPMIYVKGVASIELIRDVKSKSEDNSFYHCSTPDGYSGLILSSMVEKFLFTEKVLTLHGVSPTSAGLSYVQGGDSGQKVSRAFFQNSKNILMHQRLGSCEYSPLISLMTADFLFTVEDKSQLSFEVSAQSLIEKSLDELCDGLFNEQNIQRELQILKVVSKSFGILDDFHSLLNSKRRNFRCTLEGDAISSRQIYLNADKERVENVYEASLWLANKNPLHVLFFKGRLINALLNSIQYKLLSFKKGRRLSEFL